MFILVSTSNEVTRTFHEDHEEVSDDEDGREEHEDGEDERADRVCDLVLRLQTGNTAGAFTNSKLPARDLHGVQG